MKPVKKKLFWCEMFSQMKIKELILTRLYWQIILSCPSGLPYSTEQVHRDNIISEMLDLFWSKMTKLMTAVKINQKVRRGKTKQ